MKRQDLIDLLVWVRDYLTEYHLQPEHEMVSEIQDAIWALDEGGLSEMVEYASGRARCRWCGQNIQKGMPVIWVTTGSYGTKGYVHSNPEDCRGRLEEE